MKKTLVYKGIALFLMMGLLAGCASTAPSETAEPTPEASVSSTAETTPEATPEPTEAPIDFASLPLVRVASLKGPTGMGMVGLMDMNDKRLTKNRYEFTLASAPEEIVAMLSSESVDVAAIPTNLAATLYQVTGFAEGKQGKVRIAAINTLGVLYILERGETIQSVADLAGKTIYASGQGSVPDYVLEYILYWNGIKDAKVEFVEDHSALMTLAAAGRADIVMLPEPFVTNLLTQAEDMRVALDINKEWKEQSDSELAMGALAVRTSFSEESKAVFNTFLGEYQESVRFVNSNPQDAAKLIESYGILPSAAVAEKALPNCNIVYMDGEAMKMAAIVLYEKLYDRNAQAVGGAMPDYYFYYAP